MIPHARISGMCGRLIFFLLNENNYKQTHRKRLVYLLSTRTYHIVPTSPEPFSSSIIAFSSSANVPLRATPLYSAAPILLLPLKKTSAIKTEIFHSLRKTQNRFDEQPLYSASRMTQQAPPPRPSKSNKKRKKLKKNHQ